MFAKEANTPNPNHYPHILIAARDNARTVDLLAAIVDRMAVRITLVDSVADARDAIEEFDPDLLIADQKLIDGCGMDLVSRKGEPRRKVILLKETLEMDRVLMALRLGVSDVFVHPIDTDLLIETAEKLCRRESVRRRDVLRQTRLRTLSSKLIKDRRVLRQRVDLICNDIVHAYRQLAEKVVKMPMWTDPTEQREKLRDR